MRKFQVLNVRLPRPNRGESEVTVDYDKEEVTIRISPMAGVRLPLSELRSLLGPEPATRPIIESSRPVVTVPSEPEPLPLETSSLPVTSTEDIEITTAPPSELNGTVWLVLAGHFDMGPTWAQLTESALAGWLDAFIQFTETLAETPEIPCVHLQVTSEFMDIFEARMLELDDGTEATIFHPAACGAKVLWDARDHRGPEAAAQVRERLRACGAAVTNVLGSFDSVTQITDSSLIYTGFAVPGHPGSDTNPLVGGILGVNCAGALVPVIFPGGADSVARTAAVQRMVASGEVPYAIRTIRFPMQARADGKSAPFENLIHVGEAGEKGTNVIEDVLRAIREAPSGSVKVRSYGGVVDAWDGKPCVYSERTYKRIDPEVTNVFTYAASTTAPTSTPAPRPSRARAKRGA